MTDSRTLDGLIIGGGISGLSVAHWLGLGDHPGTWQLWEGQDHLGGTLRTERAEGYSVDWGPNGFLDREPLTLQLVDEIGLRDQLEPANEKAEDRFIYKKGKLHPVPFSPPAILTTGLLSPMEKLRIFREPFVRARKDDADESVYDFAARRIGRGAAETFVDPMVSGVFGGVAKELSLPACFPIMREMELQYGSLVRAMIAKMREKKKRDRESGVARKSGSPAGPGGRLTSFAGGLDVVISRLGERHRAIVQLNRTVQSIMRTESGWIVTDGRGQSVNTRQLIVTCPTFAAACMFKEFDSDLSSALASIPYAPIVVVATGHRRADVVHSLDGFGFLVPRNQGLRILGSIWTSSIFADRAPAGHVQFRTMLGGAGDAAALQLTDDQLWETIRRDLDPLLGLNADPVFRRIYRWERGIPQYTLGHRERRARIENLASRHPGLHFVSNAFYGVSLNECVKLAKTVADEVVQEQARHLRASPAN